MKRFITYSLFTSLHVASLWLGLVEQHDGALNVGLALTWFCIIIHWFILTDNAINELAKRKRSTLFIALNQGIDLAIALLLIYFGWFITGGLYALHIALFATAIIEANKRRAVSELKSMVSE